MSSDRTTRNVLFLISNFRRVLYVVGFLHMPARGLHAGRYTFTTCFVNGPTPTLSPSFQLA